jgi:hypothetical protein
VTGLAQSRAPPLAGLQGPDMSDGTATGGLVQPGPVKQAPRFESRSRDTFPLSTPAGYDSPGQLTRITSKDWLLSRSVGTKVVGQIIEHMIYRDVEYSVVQGIGRHLWKWSVSLDTGVSVGGQAVTKSEAVANAERAIDRALASKKLKLVPKRQP